VIGEPAVDEVEAGLSFPIGGYRCRQDSPW
jgi:hypothetical protein